jgi:hypothetical protein
MPQRPIISQWARQIAMGGATTFGERAKPAKPSIIFTVSSDLSSLHQRCSDAESRPEVTWRVGMQPLVEICAPRLISWTSQTGRELREDDCEEMRRSTGNGFGSVGVCDLCVWVMRVVVLEWMWCGVTRPVLNYAADYLICLDLFWYCEDMEDCVLAATSQSSSCKPWSTKRLNVQAIYVQNF